LASVIQRDLHAFIIEEGMKVLQEVLRQDQEALCGPAYTLAGGDKKSHRRR